MVSHGDPLFNLRLDSRDRALLDALVEHERLNKSDVVRRAIRHYAEHLGVTATKPRKK
jgi:Arc/MetJ-type ribon-helix-helix transcriptional regulator